MVGEKRFGMGPVPASPEHYLNETQVNGMTILRKFGWKLVCVRRASVTEITTVFRNSHDNMVGVLGEDGILRISNDLKVRSTPI